MQTTIGTTTGTLVLPLLLLVVDVVENRRSMSRINQPITLNRDPN
jgi:hypothetical protein